MTYRSPVEGMRRELERLDEELTSLRALPEAQPRRVEPTKPSVGKKTRREIRTLERELQKIENQIEAFTKSLGLRALTSRESASHARSLRLSWACLAAGIAVLTIHLVWEAHTPRTWTPVRCSVAYEDGDPQAVYSLNGRTYAFGVSEDDVKKSTCFVPDPPMSGVGLMSEPETVFVPLRKKLAVGWLITAIVLILFGALGIPLSFLDRRNRETGLTATDDFGSDS